MARKILLDVDPGIADALAMCFALGDPRLDVVAVTATGGNVAPRQSTRNVQGLVEQLDPNHWPRLGAADADQDLRTDGRLLCGEGGLCGAEMRVAELHHLRPSKKVIADEIRAAPGDVTIIAGGPLSNIADALKMEPDLAMQVRHLIIVGGSLQGPGDVTAAAEFNIYCDAQAAQAVFRMPLTKTLLPLDVSKRATLDFAYLDRLPSESTRTGQVLRAILPCAFRAYRQKLGMEGLMAPEALAVVAALQPEMFTTEPMHCEVEVAGELTHGATVFDRRHNTSAQANMDVVVDLDAEAAIECLTQSLSHAP
jgi:inosine-uridine nucleoside N-ribohydrolase